MVWLLCDVDSGVVRWSGCCGMWTMEWLGGLVVVGCGAWSIVIDGLVALGCSVGYEMFGVLVDLWQNCCFVFVCFEGWVTLLSGWYAMQLLAGGS